MCFMPNQAGGKRVTRSAIDVATTDAAYAATAIA